MQPGTVRSTALLLAACVAVLASLAQIIASSQSEPSIERGSSRFNSVAPPAYRVFRRLEGGLSTSQQAGLVGSLD